MHSITFVFDIDDTLGLHFSPENWERETAEVIEVYGKDFLDRHTIQAIGYPHFIFPGIPTLWRWLHKQGHRFAIFSSAVKERNEEFTDRFAELAFGDQAEEIRFSIKVFSRNDCFDTYQTGNQQAYQPIFFGNKKKVLSGVVVPPEEMPWTLLIDDDRSYMALNEEYNYIRVEIGCTGLYPISARSFQAHAYFYKAFYLAGLFQSIFDKMEKNGDSAIEAAKFIQIDSVDQSFDCLFFYPTINDIRFYQEGERILSSIDTEIKIPQTIMQRMQSLDYEFVPK